MTKEEALKLLSEAPIMGVTRKDSKLPLAEAISMAIEALENSDRSIFEEIKTGLNQAIEYEKGNLDTKVTVFKNYRPEIIYCKDCVYYNGKYCVFDYITGESESTVTRDSDDFCSCGEWKRN